MSADGKVIVPTSIKVEIKTKREYLLAHIISDRDLNYLGEIILQDNCKIGGW